MTIRSTEKCRVTVTIRSTEQCRVTVTISSSEYWTLETQRKILASQSGAAENESLPVCDAVSTGKLLRNKLTDAVCPLFLFNYIPDLLQNMRLHERQNMRFV